MLQTTTWHPDTCGCVLVYEWDDQSPEDTRVHTFKQALNTCPAHEAMGVIGPALYTTVLEENQRKNRVLGLIKATEVSWSFDSKRVLQVRLPSLALAEKATLQDTLNLQFGPGKVRLA